MAKYENPQWATPCAQFIGYMAQVLDLIDLTRRGASVMTMGPRMVNVLAETFDTEVKKVEYEERVEGAKYAARVAELEIKSDFSLLHSHALIGVWGALEGMIEDLSISRIQHDPSILHGARFSKIKIPLVEFQAMSEQDRLRFIVAELQRDLGLELKSGATKFEPLLAEIGLGGSVDRRVRDAIFEAQNLRNVFAHRGGVADRKLVANCPQLSYKVGDRVKLGQEDFARNFNGLLTYGALILNRCRSIEGMRPFDANIPGFEGILPTCDEDDGAADEEVPSNLTGANGFAVEDQSQGRAPGA
jgi:hypothetical protein